MYRTLPSFVLGFHGCDRKVGEAVLAGQHLRPSNNDYDWLGQGIYFWENSPHRALSYAKKMKRYHQLPSYESVRSPFWEGEELYQGALFRRETHVQICVRDRLRIKGYFRPLNEQGGPFQP